MSIPRLYVPALQPGAESVMLPEDEAHHVTRVLRLGAGDRVRVFDGRGHEWDAELMASARRKEAVARLIGQVAAVAEPPVRVTLAAGILKGDHMDALARDATMMGVAEVVPLASAHVTVPQKAWKTDAAIERWQRVAVASAKQCGRAVVPQILPAVDLASVLRTHSALRTVMFVEPSAGAQAAEIAAGVPARPEAALVLIGPEGGWSAGEIETAQAGGATLLHLGARTIRADAMAAVALSALWTMWGWK